MENKQPVTHSGRVFNESGITGPSFDFVERTGVLIGRQLERRELNFWRISMEAWGVWQTVTPVTIMPDHTAASAGHTEVLSIYNVSSQMAR
jgi:hypothetical protein